MLTRFGYLTHILHRGNGAESRRLHRMVAEAFIGAPPPNTECAHLDGNRANCNFRNLAWTTRKENHSHKKLHGTKIEGEKTYNHKIKERDIVEIFKSRKSGESTDSIAKRYCVSERVIDSVLARSSWSHVAVDDEIMSLPTPLFDRTSIIPCVPKITEDQVHEIDALHASGMTYRNIAIKFRLSDSAIRGVLSRRNWKRVPKLSFRAA